MYSKLNTLLFSIAGTNELQMVSLYKLVHDSLFVYEQVFVKFVRVLLQPLDMAQIE